MFSFEALRYFLKVYLYAFIFYIKCENFRHRKQANDKNKVAADLMKPTNTHH